MATCDRCGIETNKPREMMMPMLFNGGIEKRMCELCWHVTAVEQEQIHGMRHIKLKPRTQGEE